MKIKKISFGNIRDVLSRDEMKEIMAGSAGFCGICKVGDDHYSCVSYGGPCICNGGGNC